MFDEEWLGRRVDKYFLGDLRKLNKKSGVDICGESGEYHTYVTDGSSFSSSIGILDFEKVRRNEYYILNILRYEFRGK